MDEVSLLDFERRAAERLSAMALDYYQSGAGDEITLRENREAFSRLALHYRVMVDVSRRSAETSVLGERAAMPALVAPTAFHRMAHADGEIGAARAAGRAGTIMVLSTLSTTRVEDVAAAAQGPLWFQLYVYRDRRATEALVRRVEEAGCRALVLTVDAPLLGRRERDIKNGFSLPEGLRIENLHAEGMGELPAQGGGSGLGAYFASLIDPALSWRDLAWLRGITELPIVVKGVVRADDARRAVDAGARGVIVSNHGGRQVDTAPAPVTVLPEIAEAVGNDAEVLVDGGIRRGTDVIKALALGARAVLLGRPILWGLAADGEEGARRVLGLLHDEIDLAMALCGCPSVGEIGRDLVSP